jgi:hypothetical protein
MKDKVNLPGGVFELKIYKSKWHERRGIVQDSVKIHNKMTNASLAVITGLVGNTGAQTAFGYLALGTSTTAVSASHTALQAELSTLGLSRTASSNSRTTTTQTNDTLVFTASWNVSGGTTIEEIGIFNAASVGTMLARALTTSKVVISGNVVSATYSWIVVGN